MGSAYPFPILQLKDTVAKNNLNLLVFKGHLYPSDTADYEYLRARNFTSFRIPIASLPFLKKTRLSQAVVILKEFNQLWSSFIEHLETQLLKYGKVRKDSNHQLRVMVPVDDLKKTQSFLNKTKIFASRYCVSLSLTEKSNSEKTHVVIICKFAYSESINNSYAFLNILNEDTNSVEMLLEPSLKLRITRGIVSNVPTVSWVLLDRTGEHWSECVHRTGRYSSLNKEQILKVADFLMELA